MADEGEERGGEFDDLFEDLDKFFTPEDQPEERARGGAGAREAAAGAEEAGAGGSQAGPGSTRPEPEEGILPSDWLSDIEGLDLGESPDVGPGLGSERTPDAGAAEPAAAEPAAAERSPSRESSVPTDESRGPSEPADVAHPAEPAPAAAGSPPSAETYPPPGSTAEMSQQDWSRLRRVLGDEAGREAAEDVSLAPASGGDSAEDLFPYAGEDVVPAGEEEPHELTLDDLKKAPPQYKHLPRPDDEAAQDDLDAIREDQGTFLGEPEHVRDDFAEVGERPLVPEAAERRPWEEPPAGPKDAWGEPAIGEVEAAADQMAEEFRTGLPPEDELLAGLRNTGRPRTVKVGEPESLMGPTWEEPGSQVITGEPGAPAFADRNMPLALLTAAVLAVLALVSIAWNKDFFAVIAGAVILGGQAEVYAAMQRKGYQPATALGLVLGGLMLAAGYLKGEQAMLFFVVLGVVLSFLWYMVAAPKAREGALGNIGVTMLGLVYVPLLAGFVLIILAQPLSGRALTLAILGLTFLYDAAAFVVGSLWGSRALAPTISPRKSWQGLFGATLVTLAVSVATLPSIRPLTWGQSVGLALVIAVFAPLGDLAESLLKRDFGVKDMGSLLPGHGGIMDRIDSALFVLPAAFFFLRLIL